MKTGSIPVYLRNGGHFTSGEPVYIGQQIVYRLQQPNQYDNGWRPGVVLSKNNKGYALRVFLNDQFDRDIPSTGGSVYVNNRKYGDGVGEFLAVDEIAGLDGEEPVMSGPPPGFDPKKVVVPVAGPEKAAAAPPEAAAGPSGDSTPPLAAPFAPPS